MEIPVQRSPRCPSERRGYESPAPNPFGHGIVFGLFPLEEIPEEVLPNSLPSRGKDLHTRDRMGSNPVWKPVWIGPGPFSGHGPSPRVLQPLPFPGGPPPRLRQILQFFQDRAFEIDRTLLDA